MGDQYIDWVLFNKTLCLLAKRINPKAEGWVYCPLPEGYKGTNVCYICNGNVHYTEYVQHGLAHLKEHKLLTFL
jgi:hypothetical protein